MTFDGRALLEFLPAVHRLRDAELAGRVEGLLTPVEAAELATLESVGPVDAVERRRLEELRDKRDRGPLAALLFVLAQQLAVLEENLDQLYDDQFVETAAPWAVPYIGDLIGYRPLRGGAPGAGSRRAEVGHTIAFRRRKGTASMLEQLARDVTGWNARVVEYFSLLATTQYMNHVRPGNRLAPDLRDGDALEWIGGAFDALPRTLDVRRIATRGGRYNITNIGIFVWRIEAHRLRRSPATPDPTDAAGHRFRFSPLGNDTQLYSRPESEDEISHLAEPANVPAPISRRRLARDLARLYGESRSLAIVVDGAVWPVEGIAVCHLADDGPAWAHQPPAGTIAIDPVLGRLALAADLDAPDEILVTYHYGAPGDLGGGEYPRSASFESPTGGFIRVPVDEPTIQDALDALGGSGVVEIVDNGRFAETIAIAAAADRTVELRAADGRRPLLQLTGPLTLTAGTGGSIVLNGLLVAGDGLEVPAAAANELRRLALVHTTLVPGRALGPDGTAAQPGATSLAVARPDVAVSIDRSVLGALRLHPGSRASVSDSVVDAGGPGAIAWAAPDGADPPAGGALHAEAVTVVGEVRCTTLSASNSILLGHVQVERHQEGCLRFSFAPAGSRTPERFRCQPGEGPAAGNVPAFTTLRHGEAAYCQLADHTPAAIRSGADDESEMGVFHRLYGPQREADLATRLDEYLRVGLEAGLFHES